MRSKYRIKQFLILGFYITLFLLAILQTPFEVSASTVSYSEDFDDTTLMDSSTSTVIGWGSGDIRIPSKQVEYVNTVEAIFGSHPTIHDNYLIYRVAGIGIEIFDISNPIAPEYVSSFSLPTAGPIICRENFAYVAGDGLHILNITDIENVTEVSWYGPLESYQFVLHDSYGYLLTINDGIQVLDISDPLLPISVFNYTHVNATTYFRGQRVGNYLYTVDYDPLPSAGLQVINCTDPTSITTLSRTELPNVYHNLRIVGDYIYIGAVASIAIYSIVDTAWLPALVSDILCFGAQPGSLVIDGDNLYLGYSGYFKYIDLSNIAEPRVDDIASSFEFIDFIVKVDSYFIINNSTNLVVIHLNDRLSAVAQSLPMSYDCAVDEVYHFTEATLTVNDETPTSTTIDYYLSSDNGSTWEQVTPDEVHYFSEHGPCLCWKAILSSSVAGMTPKISSISLEVKKLLLPPTLDHIGYNDYNRPIFYFDYEGISVLLQLDIDQNFESPIINQTGVFHSGAFSGYAVYNSTYLANGTYYYRFAYIDDENDTGIWSDVYTLQIGTASTGGNLPVIMTLLLIVSGIGLVVIVIVVVKKRS